MPIMLFERDLFVDNAALIRSAQEYDGLAVRRPLYGISIKEDKFAHISVQQIQGNDARPVSLVDSSAPGGFSNANHNFILQAVQYQEEEKAQVLETFGDHFVYFYGDRPTILGVSGMLLNTRDFNWKNEWLRNYKQHLRGTKCVENRSRVYLAYDDVLVSGYIMATNVGQDANSPYLCPFGFNMLLMDYQDLSNTSDYVRKYEETFELEGDNIYHPEYFGPYERTADAQPRFVIDELTGRSQKVSGSNENAPASQSGGVVNQTADWVTGKKPHKQQWLDEQRALTEIESQLAADLSGSTRARSLQQYRQNSASFPLGSNTATARAFVESLKTGARNYGAVVSDFPQVD